MEFEKGYFLWFDQDEQPLIYSNKHKKILKPYVNKFGYKSVCINKKMDSYHRIVAKALIKNPNNYNVVDHINGKPNDNKLSNLRWTTVKGNCFNKCSIPKLNKLKNNKYSITFISNNLNRIKHICNTEDEAFELWNNIIDMKTYKKHGQVLIN